MTQRRRAIIALGALALLLISAAGCDELLEAQLCRDASDKICAKWFKCWPVAAVGLWLNQSNCYSKMRTWCDDSEYWAGCDIDNPMLRECNSGIDASSCGSLPAACYNILNCYKSSPPP